MKIRKPKYIKGAVIGLFVSLPYSYALISYCGWPDGLLNNSFYAINAVIGFWGGWVFHKEAKRALS